MLFVKVGYVVQGVRFGVVVRCWIWEKGKRVALDSSMQVL